MKQINLFNKNIDIKDYDCTLIKGKTKYRDPIFNLYIQLLNLCNAKCLFCDKPENQFVSSINYDKFESVLEELNKKCILPRIAITGGEPFLYIDNLEKIINSIYKIKKDAYITLNTNGYNLNDNSTKELIEIKNIKEIHLSRHHFDNKLNDNAFNINMITLDEINRCTFKHLIKLNCVLQKGLIDNAEKVKQYLEIMSSMGIREVRFISMMPLTKSYDNLYVDPTPIIKELDYCLNAGYMYDKNICECITLMYVSSNGLPVKVFFRNTKEHLCSYTRQFIYTSNNNLLAGFGGEIII